MSVKSNPIIAE